MQKKAVLFVCLGNICRSPLAEGIFRHIVESRGLAHAYQIDSCGTGSWHVGSKPHKESQRVAAQHGVIISNQRARQFHKNDFKEYPLIVAMDRQNQSDLIEMSGSGKAQIVCLREYDPQPDSLDVPDPYYGGPEGFDHVYAIIQRSCERLIDHLES